MNNLQRRRFCRDYDIDYKIGKSGGLIIPRDDVEFVLKDGHTITCAERAYAPVYFEDFFNGKQFVLPKQLKTFELW